LILVSKQFVRDIDCSFFTIQTQYILG